MRLFFLLLLSSHLVFSQKPNIVWISVEDMSPRLPAYGDSTILTPNIDKIAKNGVRFTRMHTTAGVCAPSRNAIATGRIQTSNGGQHMRTQFNVYTEKTGLPGPYSAVMPADVKHFAELLRAEGYYTTNNDKTDYQFKEPLTVWDESNTKAHFKNRGENQPFFAVFNSNTTHESQIWGRAKKPLRVDPKKVKVPTFLPDTDSVRLDIARHYSNISEMDEWVGGILKDIELSGQAQNTIVMFWSDHGDGLPFSKREIYQRVLWVPFIVSAPSNLKIKGLLENGQKDTRLLSAVDWAPTVLNLAGVSIPSFMQGKPFLGLNHNKVGHKYIFAARDRLDSEYDRIRTIIGDEYQLIVNYELNKPIYADVDYRKSQPGMLSILNLKNENRLPVHTQKWFNVPKEPYELYHLKSDPDQLYNLINDKKHEAIKRQLITAYNTWQKEVKDFSSVSEKEMLFGMWNGDTKPPKTAQSEILINNKLLTIKTKTKGASIAYKYFKESEPKRWEVYKEKPIKLEVGYTLKINSHRIGYTPVDTVFKF